MHVLKQVLLSSQEHTRIYCKAIMLKFQDFHLLRPLLNLLPNFTLVILYSFPYKEDYPNCTGFRLQKNLHPPSDGLGRKHPPSNSFNSHVPRKEVPYLIGKYLERSLHSCGLASLALSLRVACSWW